MGASVTRRADGGAAVPASAGILAALAAAALLGASPQALAACTGTTTMSCDSAGNPYSAGIATSAAGQTITLGAGVAVDTTATGNIGVNMSGGGVQTLNLDATASIKTVSSNNAVQIYNSFSQAVVNGAGASINVSGFSAYGLYIDGAGSIEATIGAVTSDAVGGIPVYVNSTGGTISLTTGAVTATKNNDLSNGLILFGVFANANGALTVDTSGGAVAMTGSDTFHAIQAGGGGVVSVTTAAVSTKSANAFAINVSSSGTGAFGALTVDSSGGLVKTEGPINALGISAAVSNGAATGALQVTTAGVETAGQISDAIKATNAGTGAVSVDTTAGAVKTAGNGSRGVFVSSAKGGDVTVTTGNVSTKGTASAGVNAHGIEVSTSGKVTIDSSAGTISTEGIGARGISVDKTGTAAVRIDAGTITTTAQEAQGIHVFSGTSSGATPDGGAVSITARAISTTGDSSGGLFGAGADGIEIHTYGAGADGKVTIDTSAGVLPNTLGSVSTIGARSRGILVESGRRVGDTDAVGGGAIEIRTGTVSTEGVSAGAIDATTFGTDADGNITITALGKVSTKGAGPAGTDAGPAQAIAAVSYGSGGKVSVTAKDIATEGDNANGVFAQSNRGSVVIDTTGGAVTTKGVAASGVTGTYGRDNDTQLGAGSVSIKTGNVTTEGTLSDGIDAFAGGASSTLVVDSRGGTVTTKANSSTGINAVSGQSAFTGVRPEILGGSVDIKTGSVAIEGSGTAINVTAWKSSSVKLDTTAGTVSTKANGSAGINIRAEGSPVEVKTADMTLLGGGGAPSSALYAIRVSSLSGNATTGAISVDTSAGTIAMSAAANTWGMFLTSSGGPVDVVAGSMTIAGSTGIGAYVESYAPNNASAVTFRVAGDIVMTGKYGIGALVLSSTTAAGGVHVTVDAGASVTGGWQADMSTPGYNGAAAGLVIGGKAGTGFTARLDNNGSVGALNDLAIASSGGSYDVGLGYGYVDSGGAIDIENNGTVSGFFRLRGDGNIFHNISSNSLDLRDFADTTGDGVRDTERVAVADMGGAGSTFDNDANGWVRLATVPSMTTLATPVVTAVTAGEVLPGGDAAHSIANAGVEQGHMLRTATFRNAGTITMMDAETGGSGAVAGDVLVITGGTAPGSNGGGTFVSDGGQLRIDAVLDDGAAPKSDMLVVDGTSVGAGGATRVTVANAGGLGAETVGDGIKVVDVLDAGRSAAGAFSGTAMAGGYLYTVLQGGIADPADGDWYLRSTGLRDAVPLYAGAPTVAALYGSALIAGHRDRTGGLDNAGGSGTVLVSAAGPVAVGAAGEGTLGWGRAFGLTGSHDSADIFSQGASFDFTLGGIQAGYDLYRDYDGAAMTVAGFFVAIGTAEARAEGFSGGRAGRLGFNAYSAGGYLTRTGPTGGYLDLVFAGTFYADVAARPESGEHFDTHGAGVLASAEAGVPLQLARDIVFEPQMQVTYQRIGMAGAADGFSIAHFDASESLKARVGARLAKRFGGGTEPVVTAWLQGDIVHEFLGRSHATFFDMAGDNPLGFDAVLAGTTAAAGLGLSVQATPTTGFFATVHAGWGIAETHDRFWSGNIGLRHRW
jgi:autotransporter family porin